VEVEVLGEGGGYDEVRCGRVEEETFDDADFGRSFREVDVFS
jgi:hypothetical protein